MSETVGRPMEILLVEDSLMFARLAMGALKQGQIQHRMTWLNTGEDAVAFLAQSGQYARAPRPDLILLDLGLPGIDGREVLARLRANDELKAIPVVVMTASTSEDDLAAVSSLQVEGYLVKPIDLTKFLDLIRELRQFWKADMILPHAVLD